MEQPIFDSLSTQEEVFSREAATTQTDEEYEQEPALQANAAMPRRTIAAIDYSSLLQLTPKPRSKVLLFAGAVVVILAFVAGGAMYLRHNPGRAAQVSNATPVSSQSAPEPAVMTPNPAATLPVATTSPAAPQPQVQRSADVPVAVPTKQQNSITVAPVHASQKSATVTSHPIISTGMANIYAGDLKAHAQITPRASAQMTSPVPDVNAPAPKEIPEASSGNGLGSLVSGSEHSNLVAPAKPDPVQGGNVQLPKLLSSVAPTYPQLAATNHVEGEVKIQAEINDSGRVTSTKVISGPILLRSAAMNAVRQWKYSPAMLDGKAISTQYAVTVRFRLNQ
ncbi:MAG: TonB family protein [Candidatus Acidiferrales bacterium]